MVDFLSPLWAFRVLAVDEWGSPEPLPPEQVISDEEKAILWRSLERIPEIYREPLVLFYREHQSIEAVAQDLGLSEDAVKQRLSRGRKLLQEQFVRKGAERMGGRTGVESEVGKDSRVEGDIRDADEKWFLERTFLKCLAAGRTP